MNEEFKPISFTTEYVMLYWHGASNIFARYVTYLQRCFALINDAKWVLGLFGLGVFKSDIVIPGTWLIASMIISLPVMIAIGRWDLYKLSKAREFATVTKGSVLGFKQYNIQVAILNELRKQNETKS